MDAELSLDKETLIYDLIKSASEKWKEIGLRLGLSEERLHRVQSQCAAEPNRALHKMIQAWLRGEDKSKIKGVNWSCLTRALKHKSVDELELAVAVEASAKAPLADKADDVADSLNKPLAPKSLVDLFNQYILDLTEATSDLETYCLAVELCCAGLIPREVKEDVLYTKSLSKMERAERLYHCIPVLLKNSFNEDACIGTLRKFSSILCKQENQSLVKIAHELQGKDFQPTKLVCEHNPSCCPSSIDKFQEFLKKKYLNQSKFQSVNAWPPTVSVDYVNLQIIEANSKKVKDIAEFSRQGSVERIVKISKMIELKDITTFNEEGNQKLILIEGAPGIGKTTVANRICEEWAKGNLYQEYNLVFYIALRFTHMKIANSLSDLLKEYQHPDYCSSNFDPSVVMHIRNTNGRGVLLVLDGWDELNRSSLDETSFLPRLIRGDYLPHIHCIVTSRPVATTMIRTTSFCQSTRIIQIVGFTKENIETYVRLYFAKKPSFSEHLLEKLHHYPNIMSACYVAINATIICYVFDEGEGVLPDTLTEVYHLFILHAIKRHIEKNINRERDDYLITTIEDELQSSCLQEINEKRHQLLLSLCDFALKGILTNEYSFKRKSLKEACKGLASKIDEFDGFGLVQFYDSRSPSGPISFAYFLHLTIQEFLAAYTLSCKDEKEVFDRLGEIFANGNYPFLTKFLYGLCGSVNKHKKALDAFVYTDTISQLLLMECIYESKDDEKCKYVAERYSKVLKIENHRLQPYQALCCGNVMLKSKEKWTIEWINVCIGEDELRVLHDCSKVDKFITKVSCVNSSYLSKQAHDLMREFTASQSAEHMITWASTAYLKSRK